MIKNVKEEGIGQIKQKAPEYLLSRQWFFSVSIFCISKALSLILYILLQISSS